MPVKTSVLWCVALLGALLGPFAAFAQYRGSPSANPGGLASNDSFGNVPFQHLQSVTGTVVDSDNKGLANARIELRDIRTGLVAASGYSTASGSFELQDVPQGNYEVVASAGILETRERVDLSRDNPSLTLRLQDAPAAVSGGQQTVSVAEMQTPGKARNELHKAQAYVSKNKLAEASALLVQLVANYPSFADAHSLLGIVHLDEGNPAAAAKELERAVQLDPHAAVSYVALGAAYNSLGQYDDAARTLDRASSLSPNSWQLYFEMAKASLGRHNFRVALGQIARAEQLCDSNFLALHVVKAHALLGLKDYPQAVAEFKYVLDREPRGPYASDARQTLEQVQALAPDRPESAVTP